MYSLLTSRHSHRRQSSAWPFDGLAQPAGETAVAPLVVHRPQVRAGLIEAVRPSSAVCRAAASGAGGVACIGVITAGHACVFHLFCALCAAGAAAFLRLLCADDLLGCAASLTTMCLVAGSVLGEGWCAERSLQNRSISHTHTPTSGLHHRPAVAMTQS